MDKIAEIQRKHKKEIDKILELHWAKNDLIKELEAKGYSRHDIEMAYSINILSFRSKKV